jgi:DMSO/TMAO reductase YedYZ molybdopterin-dependent catalytic subunit
MQAQWLQRLAVIATLALGLTGVLAVAGCASTAGTGHTTVATASAASSSSTSGTSTSRATATTGELQPIVVPTLPAEIPRYTEVDPATGLHMTGTPQVIDLASYRLKVEGKVAHPLSLSYDDLRRLPKVTATPTLNCPGYFTDVATWSGVPLATILALAGPKPEAKQILMGAADGYSHLLSLEDALQPENFLAYEWEGQPLPVLHGFPLRAVFPNKPGSYWVKWLMTILVE